MASNIDIQKVMHALGESKLINLDMSLREVVESSGVSVVNSVAHLEPWDLICYTWVTFLRRRGFDDRVVPGAATIDEQRFKGMQERISG